MNEPYQMAREFHSTFAPLPPSKPKAFTKERGSFRAGFKVEEIVEFLYGVSKGDEVEFNELLYFTYGSFALIGVDPKPIFEIVHQANMGKLFPDGKPRYHPITNKVMKPEDWEEKYAPEPLIKIELERQKGKAE